MTEVVWQSERPKELFWLERRSVVDRAAAWTREPGGPYPSLGAAKIQADISLRFEYRVTREQITQLKEER